MKIGYVQTSPTFNEKTQNFEQVKNLLSNTKVDLNVLPEL
jgi:predicted amidohydrolase